MIIKFLTAQTISLFGSSVVQYAMVWYITLSTSSGKMLTISTLCGFLPQIAISLFAGVWIDRYDKKKVIMISDSVIALSTLILAILFLSGHKNIWLLFLVLAVRSAGTGVQTPAVNAIIPKLVPEEKRMKINGIYSTLSSAMMFLSPVVSGVILSFVTLEATLFLDVVTAVIGVCITVAIPLKFAKNRREDKGTGFQSMQEGLNYLKKHPNSHLRNSIFLFPIQNEVVLFF